MDTDDLVTGRFTGCGDDTNCREQVTATRNQFQQAQAMKDAERLAVLGVGVLESLLRLGVLPVGSTKEAARVGKGGYMVSIALSRDSGVVVEVGMGDDEIRYISWMNALFTKLID